VTRRVLLPALVLCLLRTIPALAQTWEAVDVPTETGNVRCFAESASGVRFLCSVATFGIGTRTFGGIFRSDDLGDWQRVVSYSVLGLAILPGRFGDFTVYAVDGEGVIFSPDGGRTWDNAPPLPGAAGTASIAVMSGGALLVGSYAGTVRSDNFPIWQTTTGMEDFVARAFAFDPARPSRAYAAAMSAADPGKGGVFVSDDEGRSWTQLDPAGLSISATAIAVDPLSPRILYAVAASQLYRSDDGGRSWTALGAQDLPAGAVNNVVIHPENPAVLFASTSSGAGVYRSLDRGDTWTPANPSFTPGSSFNVTALAFAPPRVGSPTRLQAATYPSGVYVADVPVPDGVCQPSSTALCLGRFRVSVEWQATPTGPSQAAQAMPVTSDSGYFWFFGADNVELMVKILDGRNVNGNFWVFYGALSNVAYRVTVDDVQTGNTKAYTNPWGTLASEADTAAFPAAGLAASTAPPPPRAPRALRQAEAQTSCSPDPMTLCVDGGRFRVAVDWQQTPLTPPLSAQAVPLTDDTGYFWFFGSANVELVVKVLDGRADNGHFWVFYGALSDIEYTLTVTDTLTGEVRAYHNPPGNLASGADTTAF